MVEPYQTLSRRIDELVEKSTNFVYLETCGKEANLFKNISYHFYKPNCFALLIDTDDECVDLTKNLVKKFNFPRSCLNSFSTEKVITSRFNINHIDLKNLGGVFNIENPNLCLNIDPYDLSTVYGFFNRNKDSIQYVKKESLFLINSCISRNPKAPFNVINRLQANFTNIEQISHQRRFANGSKGHSERAFTIFKLE